MTETIDTAHRRILASHPEIEALWKKTAERREVSEFLLRARYRAGLSQSQIAREAGWDKAFVSRLESVSSRFPDLQTISRYMTACGATVGLAVMESSDPNHAGIIDAVPLNAAKPGQPLSGGKPKASVKAPGSRRRQAAAVLRTRG
jgi:transcriptional regulator with XRE-family HTH domain